VTPIEHPPSDALAVSTVPPVQPATEPPAGAAPRRFFSPSRALVRVALALLLGLLAWLAVYLAISVPKSWFPAAPPMAFAASGLALTRGSGQVVDEELRVTAPDATGLTLISVATDLRSIDYAAIAWITTDLPQQAVVRMLWRTDYAPGKLNAIDVPVELRRTQPVMVANNPAWIGRVTGLALAIQGPLSQPIRVRGVIAKPMGALDILGDRVREWLAFEEWSGTSINTVAGGADIQGLHLPVLLALSVALAAAVAALIERQRPGTFGASMPIVLSAIFLLAWLILDARWTGNLVRQEWRTTQQYAAIGTRDKHLASDDTELFAFVEKARRVLPSPPVRIFVAADANYFRGRAAYHLSPHSVFFDPSSNELQWAGAMRPGDWLLVYQQRGIQYDASLQMLKWQTGQTTGAELKLVEPGAALFRIR
jgi:hypothetical protein